MWGIHLTGTQIAEVWLPRPREVTWPHPLLAYLGESLTQWLPRVVIQSFLITGDERWRDLFYSSSKRESLEQVGLSQTFHPQA